MSNDRSVNQSYISPKLSLSSNLNKQTKEHYKKLYQKLPNMEVEQLMITGVELQLEKLHTIKVLCFIRSTIKEPIRIKRRNIILFDVNLDPFAEKDEAFKNLGTLLPNTAKPFMIEFSNEHLKQWNINNLSSWSLDFKENSRHRIDFSSFNENKLSPATRSWLQELCKRKPLKRNELSFMGFSASLDESNNLAIHLLIRNGTDESLKIKQLPLNFYDATEELVATADFSLNNFTVHANTSKPVALIFPANNIIKDHLDLSNWSIASRN